MMKSCKKINTICKKDSLWKKFVDRCSLVTQNQIPNTHSYYQFILDSIKENPKTVDFLLHQVIIGLPFDTILGDWIQIENSLKKLPIIESSSVFRSVKTILVGGGGRRENAHSFYDRAVFPKKKKSFYF